MVLQGDDGVEDDDIEVFLHYRDSIRAVQEGEGRQPSFGGP